MNEELFKKYMAHVRAFLHTACLTDDYRNFSSVKFTDEEWAQLKELKAQLKGK
jgi:RNA recognition motif-containing protein